MMVSMETYLRRLQRRAERLLISPRLRSGGMLLLWAGSGFVLSAASILGFPQPLAMGLITALSGWPAAVSALGAAVGYPVFWGLRGSQGIVWTASGCLLALMLGKGEEKREMPLMIPAIAAFFTAASGLGFQLILRDSAPVWMFLLRTAVTFFSALLFTQATACRDAVTDWLVGGVAVFAMAQVSVNRWLNLGYLAGGLLGAAGAFPAAALAGLGLDLARVTPIPMTAAFSAGYFLRMLPFRKRWQRNAAPAMACAAAMVLCGIRDPTPIPGLVLGGMAGLWLPPQTQLNHRRGETGAAQVRLEMGAEMMAATQRLIAAMELPPIDEAGLLEKVHQRACESCSARRSCAQQEHLEVDFLYHPLEADCRKPGRLLPELRRAQDQLRYLKGERQRQQEYRGALIQQYRFLGDYLRGLADRLPRRGETAAPAYRIELSARSRGKERANGDKCAAFPGTGCRYYFLLCDGMGTGLGAAQEGQRALKYLRQMLLSGFPPEHCLRSYNSLLALRGAAGAVTVDLAEFSLDTGLATLYKWGAAPSWVLTRKGAEKIGTASPPPGIAVEGLRESVEKLSLRRGEVLIVLSDGVDGEEVRSRSDLTPDQPPGELAAKILEVGRERAEDDATAAAIRLRPTSLPPS